MGEMLTDSRREEDGGEGEGENGALAVGGQAWKSLETTGKMKEKGKHPKK